MACKPLPFFEAIPRPLRTHLLPHDHPRIDGRAGAPCFSHYVAAARPIFQTRVRGFVARVRELEISAISLRLGSDPVAGSSCSPFFRGVWSPPRPGLLLSCLRLSLLYRDLGSAVADAVFPPAPCNENFNAGRKPGLPRPKASPGSRL